MSRNSRLMLRSPFTGMSFELSDLTLMDGLVSTLSLLHEMAIDVSINTKADIMYRILNIINHKFNGREVNISI